VDGGAPIAQALSLMIQANVGPRPVIQAARVAGVIRLRDLYHEGAKAAPGDQA
jgi:CBS domain-containing protein